MIDDFILSVQRLARSSAREQFRTNALALVRDIVPFDTASWGTTKPDKIGVKPCSVAIFGQTEALVQSYLAVRGHDRVGPRTIAHPGEAQVWSVRDRGWDGHEAFRHHCEAFQHFHILSTMNKGSLGSQHNYITLARGRVAPSFSETDRATIQRLFPHLFDAWVVNHSWHMNVSRDPDHQAGTVTAICSSTGELLGEYGDFARLLAAEFHDWSPPLLPAAIMTAMERRGCWRGTGLTIHPDPVADVVFLTARAENGVGKLTPRESAIAQQAAEGLSYKEIARVYGLSPATIRAHLHNIYGKLGVPNKTALSRVMYS